MDFRRFFFRGLATLLPTILTIVVMVKCFEFIQDNISVHINKGVIYLVLMTTNRTPEITSLDETDYKTRNNLMDQPTTTGMRSAIMIDKLRLQWPSVSLIDENDYKREHDLLGQPTTSQMVRDIRRWKLQQQWTKGPQSLVGFAIAIVLVYFLGRILASFIGRKVWHTFELAVQQVPGCKQVYPYVKQVTDFLFGENKIQFTRVVAVPYPRRGIWSVGLVTGAGFRHVSQTVKEEFLTIFIPSSPTPVTGYVIYVKKSEVIDLPISIEEALRFTVSAGVVVPDHQALPTQRVELASAPLAAETSENVTPSPQTPEKD